MKRILLQKHFAPVAIDDKFSARVWMNLIDNTDPDYLFFVAEEMDTLQKLSTKIDDDLNTMGWTFFPQFAKLFKASLVRARGYIDEHCARPFILTEREKYFMDTAWASGEKALKERWRILLKTEVLYDLARARMTVEKSEQEYLTTKETVSRKKIQAAKIRGINRFLEHSTGVDEYLKTLFLKSISTAFDPHSVYMSADQMQSYVGSLSTEGYYFGFALHENEFGENTVTGIVPGEPAWRSGILEVGDVIEKVRWEGKEWVELNGLITEEIDFLFAESNSAVMEFAVRKPDGQQKFVKLKKERDANRHTVARSFILGGKRPVGYIALPNFYSDFGIDGAPHSANDVAKEIIKLKNHDIQGLILDLRFNGGGSAKEAVDIAGIFIDVGPVAIEKERDGETITVKDTNRGTIYDGPLVVMVNGSSASASELLAAALQDHRRAIIVGTPTYGKAVAQEMFSLQLGHSHVDFSRISNNGYGYTAVTTAKLYRINGKTIQQSGLIPDITVPGLYEPMEREGDMPYSLASDSVTKKVHYRPMAEFPIPHLREKSSERVATSPAFETLLKYLNYVKTETALTEVVVDWKSVKEKIESEKNMHSALSKAVAKSDRFSVTLHEFAKGHMDEYTAQISEAWIRNLSKDLSVEEAYNIICDYIDSVNRN